MSDLALVGIVAGGTLFIRASLVSLLAGVEIPERVEAALQLVSPAVLAGLVAQTLVLEAGEIRSIGSWQAAAVIAMLVAWRTRSVSWTLVLGMGAVWLLEALTT